MTRPYKRACHQTNFSEGGFVKKDPFFSFFFFLNFPFPFSLVIFKHFFSLHLFKEGWQSDGPLACGGSPVNIGKMR